MFRIHKKEKPFFFFLFEACVMKRMWLPSLHWEPNHSMFAQILLQRVWFRTQQKGAFTVQAFRHWNVDWIFQCSCLNRNAVCGVEWVQLWLLNIVVKITASPPLVLLPASSSSTGVQTEGVCLTAASIKYVQDPWHLIFFLLVFPLMFLPLLTV